MKGQLRTLNLVEAQNHARGRRCQDDILRHTCSRIGRTDLALRALVGEWFHHSLLRSVLRHMRSCYHSILLSRRLRNAVDFESVRRSLPEVSCSNSRNEMQFCTASIKSLIQARPYLTLADVELFLQGWFLSEKWFRHMSSESHIGQPGSQNPPATVRIIPK